MTTIGAMWSIDLESVDGDTVTLATFRSDPTALVSHLEPRSAVRTLSDAEHIQTELAHAAVQYGLTATFPPITDLARQFNSITVGSPDRVPERFALSLRVTGAQARDARQRLVDDLAGLTDSARADALGAIPVDGPASSLAEHGLLPGSGWQPDRVELHNRIIDREASRWTEIPRARRAIVVAAPEVDVIFDDEVGVSPAEFARLDLADLRTAIFDLGGFDPLPGLADADHGPLLHAEVHHLAARLLDRLARQGVNLVIAHAGDPAALVSGLQSAGYVVHGYWVSEEADADVEWRLAFDEWTAVLTSSGGAAVLGVTDGAGLHAFAVGSLEVFRATPRDGIVASRKAVRVAEDARVSVTPTQAVLILEDLANRPSSSDLTLVGIEGHDLFWSVSQNQIRRVDMPQIPNDRLAGFKDWLASRGVSVTARRVLPEQLRATQNELDGRKVGQILNAIRMGTFQGDAVYWVSSDGRLLDGHHRWAAEVVLSLGEAERPVRILQAATPMTSLLGLARDFALGEGIDSKTTGE